VLVVDASVVVPACGSGSDFSELGDADLVAPSLMWSEARSALHEAAWRGLISASAAHDAHEALERAPIQPRTHRRLSREAWAIADQFGWAKTFDAEYVALARLLDCRLVTADARLRRGADRTSLVVGPDEL
jgi:predicted nucleic acid-binding protein